MTKGMYLPEFEHDACGIGLIANIKREASHQILCDGILMLENMEHRGGCGAEPETGDGAGIMTEIPLSLLNQELKDKNLHLEKDEFGLGMVFLPKPTWEECLSKLLRLATSMNFELMHVREVPVDNRYVGPTARENEPHILQIFLTHTSLSGKDLERKLYVLKKYASRQLAITYPEFYISSLSTTQIIYKGQLRTDQLKKYYLDLQNPAFTTAFAIIHSRFSTNTFPKWSLAQPFRYVAHNGEINTIRGNVNKMKSKEVLLVSPYFSQDELKKLLPICDHTLSDSANLDELVELLIMSGRSLPHALMMLVPEAWQYNKQLDEKTKAFYKYSASIMEPWDGPAALCFTDGNLIGAALDRNGLRPCRYTVTFDDRLIIASETGALPLNQKLIKSKGRLQPGQMIVADFQTGLIKFDEEIKDEVANQKPYGEWIKKHRIKLRFLPGPINDPETIEKSQLKRLQVAHGYTTELIEKVLIPMGLDGKEPIGSMGLEVPLAGLSAFPQHPANYLKQIFAQVSNPPIDPIRERLVMSLFTRIGEGHNILIEEAEDCRQVHITRPVIRPNTYQKILELSNLGFNNQVINSLFDQNETLLQGIERICKEAELAVMAGAKILIISDAGSSKEKLPIPTLLATGAIHHQLIEKRLRAKTSIVVHAADAIEVHHFATLIGYGASAVMPYLAFSELEKIAEEKKIASEVVSDNYVQAVGKGLLKIMSKMGISTLQSYQSAQIFEAVGLSSEVINKCLKGTTSRIEGNNFDHFEQDIRDNHLRGYIEESKLKHGGVYSWRRGQENHLIDPETIHLLQKSTKLKNYDLFKKYSERLNNPKEKLVNLRHLLNFKRGNPIAIEEVEPVDQILKRFATGAMSFGSISHEAHTTLAIAMNRMGGKSNSGEGGEDESRYKSKENGDSERSRIKQVASGRFGVTSHYLNNADEIQIKIAQGAKPGEGGQLPGHKVDKWIARVRMSTPGVDLISPPPHHDIYSIEDLAQLIFDLKNANPDARINVKLVSETGVGTIAAGVAKGFADAILISGADGGTGASPLSSIKHAGLPWEMGLSEAQQTLVKNRLRSRVVLQADGKMMTGRDIAIATLLGAEEWGVSTAALIAEGCIMMRKCHLNTCPVGIATQDERLRKLFTGDPEDVVTLFRFMAQELREIMADLGFKTIHEMVGQAHMLEQNKNLDARGIDISPILHYEEVNDTRYNSRKQQPITDDVIDHRIWRDVKEEVENGEVASYDYEIKNTDRSTGAIISSIISKSHGKAGLPEDQIKLKFNGSAGQSFGAFLAKGIKFTLEGDANDYVGKGLSGGRIIIHPKRNVRFRARHNTIIGNVALYGASSGEAYINGIAGERFAVRNSGAVAVVEGLGDHGCEYMTGGTVLVLGKTGKNFAAGMSGGIAYVLDSGGTLKENTNMEMVIFDAIDSEDVNRVRALIINHLRHTSSSVAQEILLDWNRYINHLVKVIPMKYKSILDEAKAEMPMTPIY
ncbi:glutamate synthase large subunit [Ekhidna sp.]|uniref:glutamate synthase large subunit n=1 Tax=Ekhidna sp. TaxID=2608089 RepID=UPI003299D5E2